MECLSNSARPTENTTATCVNSEPLRKLHYSHTSWLWFQCAPTLKSEKPPALQNSHRQPPGEKQEAMVITPAMVKFEKDYTNIQVINPHDHLYTINASAILTNFSFLTPNKAKHVKPIAPEHLSVLTNHPDKATTLINQLFHDEPTTSNKKWYPTPEIFQDAQTFNSQERRIYDPTNLRQQEKLETTTSDEQKLTFLSRFNWDDSQLTIDEKAPEVEYLLVKYPNIFARHRLDIDCITEFMV